MEDELVGDFLFRVLTPNSEKQQAMVRGYSEELEDDGYEFFADVVEAASAGDIDEDYLKEKGVKPGHLRKLMAAIQLD